MSFRLFCNASQFTHDLNLSDIHSVNTQTKHFLKLLTEIIHNCFKKTRIKDTCNKVIEELFKQQKELKFKTDKESKVKLMEVEKEFSTKISEDIYQIVKDEVDKVSSDEGGFNSGHLRRLKSKLKPKAKMYPTSMVDKNIEVETSSKDIEKLTLDPYIKVLENRQMRSNALESYQKEREALCEQRILKAKENITPNWNVSDVNYVINFLRKRSQETCMDCLMS